MPFYEFLPIIGSIVAMFSGLAYFWRFRRERAEESLYSGLAFEDGGEPEKKRVTVGELVTDKQAEDGIETFGEPYADRRITRGHPEWLKRLPFLLFVSWWGIFNVLAYTLAGEKMPWLGTHLTVPLILLTAWYCGRAFERVEIARFLHRGWAYMLLIPLLLVALFRFIGPLLFGQVFSGLTRGALSQTYEALAALVIIGLVAYVLYRVIQQTGWLHFRRMAGVAAFVFLGLLTFRSAWMASFINYDLATEYLVYAHAAPAIKTVLADLEEMSLRTTDGMNMVFAYDNEVSWPYSWYFRNFTNARYFGSSPSAQQLEDAVAVVVGDGNRALVEPLLEDRYYRFEYNRLWWPMQDYFGLTPERVLNALDLSPANTQAAQIRQGMWDIWWARDYSVYGQAVGKDFSIQHWPVADRMSFYVRKDVAAQIWSLGVGEGTTGAVIPEEVNLCVENWDPRPASLVIGSLGQQPGQLARPLGVAVAPDGQLYVADEGGYRIAVFDAAGAFQFTFGQRGGPFDASGSFLGNETTGGLFERPAGVAVGPSGNIYVADTWNFRVQVFSPEGEFLRSWGQRGEFGFNAAAVPEDAFWAPRGIAVDSEERVYVADTGNKRVRVYTSNGQYLWDIGSGGSGIGQLDEPVGLAISPDGLLYVADTWNDRISVFTLDGEPANLFPAGENQLVNSFRVRGWSADLGNRPYIALDSSRGIVYITDPDAGRVLIYDTAGNCLGSFGQPSRELTGLNQFNTVGGIATDSEGFVYAADAGNGRILRFDPFNRPVVSEQGDDEQAQSSAEATDEILPADSGATSELTAEVEMTEEAVG
jgi:DNA-binding beta-propeller fold protein YncE